MLMTPRLLTHAALGLAALAATASALQAPTEREILVAVWAEDGQLLTEDTEVNATSATGPIKGTLEASGHFMLPGAGTPTRYGLKTTLEVMHPFYGTELIDLRLSASDTTTLDLVFDYDGRLLAQGDTIIKLPQGTSNQHLGVATADDCGDAIGVGANSSTLGLTTGATVDGVDDCGTAISAPGVWYTVTGTGNTLTASTCSASTDYDTKISVFCGDCDGLNCIGGNDDGVGCDDFQSEFSWCSQAGATYYILVHGFDDNTGTFELNMSDDGIACDDFVTCLASGACCIGAGCSILTAPACADAGGAYKGDFTQCNTVIGSRQYTSGLLNLDIPDEDPVTGVSHSINVPLSFRLADLDVGLFINHTWTGDIQVILEHNGISAMIVDRPGFPALTFGCGEDNWTGIVIDDEGSGGAIEDQCPVGGNLTSGPAFTPANPLSAFNGQDAAGTWTLTVLDNAEFDTGSLVAWRLFVSRGNGTTACQIVQKL